MTGSPFLSLPAAVPAEGVDAGVPGHYGNPIVEVLVGDLTDQQRDTIRQVFGGMLRERAGSDGKAVLENVVHIGIGTK